jgi:hypothetical protein
VACLVILDIYTHAYQSKATGISISRLCARTNSACVYIAPQQFVVVYIENIRIFSKTEAEHQAHVRLVLEALKREKFYVCKAKSSFAQKEIKYLGHIVDTGHLS